jgi:hypothetical protein
MALSVPKSIHAGLKVIADLDEDVIRRIVAALGAVSPAGSLDRLVDEMLSRLEGNSVPNLSLIVRTLLSLESGRELCGLDASVFVAEVCESLREDRDFGGNVAGATSGLPLRLESLLQSGEALGVTAKALAILSDHEHPFLGARILSDVRTVFKTNLVDPPAGAVTVHMLGIHYQDGHAHKDMFLALDLKDLRQLRDTIDRALEKEKHLHEMLSRSNILHLEVE